MAPEVITDVKNDNGRVVDDRSADMWSLGVMFMWMVEGELSDAWMNAYRYYKDDKRKCGIFQCLIGLYQRQHISVDAEIHDLISKFLVMAPSQRFTATQGLFHPWLLRGPLGISEDGNAWNRQLRRTV